ncbi:MAG: hypothetical protein ACI31R_05270 [Bacilli bacterium]
MLIMAILGLFSCLIGSSYAYLTYVSKTNNSTIISAGTLAMNFKSESNAITLSSALPQKDSDALSNNLEYEFTIENTGSISASYKVTLDNTCVQNKEYTINGEVVKADLCIPNEYIKVAIKEGTGDYKVIDYKNSNDNSSYVIESGSLSAK